MNYTRGVFPKGFPKVQKQGGLVNDYQTGGQVVSKTIRGSTPYLTNIEPSDVGGNLVQRMFSVPASEVGGGEGLRYYLGEANMSNIPLGVKVAGLRARGKMASTPEDSIPAALALDYFNSTNETEEQKPSLNFLKKLIGKKQGGPVDYYQTGGQVQPRKQQEMRNPAMYYGPPIELMGPDSSAYNEAQSEFEAFMDSLETKRNTNPFTGKPMDTDADIKRLLERMKQSKIPRSGQRMIMRQGGPIPYQNGGEIPDARMMRPSPEAQERLLNDLRAQGAIMGDNPGDRGGYFPLASQVEPDALMGTIRSDRRIKPLEPDTYIQRIPNAGRFDKSGMQFPVYQEEVSQVPKLSTAYLASFGMETPLSREQQALLQRKMIAPETLNPKVKGLINRALVQRLANEED